MNALLMDAPPAKRIISHKAKSIPRKARKRDHVFTLGIEEEFQIIDPETRALHSHIQQILADGKIALKNMSSRSCTSRRWNSAQRFAAMLAKPANRLSIFGANWRCCRRGTA
jgi:hypothetical protein